RSLAFALEPGPINFLYLYLTRHRGHWMHESCEALRPFLIPIQLKDIEKFSCGADTIPIRSFGFIAGRLHVKIPPAILNRYFSYSAGHRRHRPKPGTEAGTES